MVRLWSYDQIFLILLPSWLSDITVNVAWQGFGRRMGSHRALWEGLGRLDVLGAKWASECRRGAVFLGLRCARGREFVGTMGARG
ncbi:hypothetical protein B0H16DRAFT_1651855 [Mycena metata]|uniref:Uncharacterized protein n=1 Tax=Mycena metata TaxID=1033252 RepID=A0AAD7DN35_9AGAR|nr:hypothetical protein B0H16DRAFT_1651855 [Mycena metata]